MRRYFLSCSFLLGLHLPFQTLAADLSENEFVKSSKVFAELERKRYLISNSWTQNYWCINELQEPNQKLDPQYSSAMVFLKQSAEQKNKIRKRSPSIKHLEKMVDLSQLTDIEKKLSRILEQGQKLRPSNLGLVKDAILQYHQAQLELPGSSADLLLGIEYDKTEATVDPEKFKQFKIWLGISSLLSQTSYELIREMYRNVSLTSRDTVYDLGSGYGRVLFYGAFLHPDVKFKGIEIVPERNKVTVAIAESFKLKNLEFITGDVLENDYSDGTVFYIYNSFPSIMKPVFDRLQGIAKKHKITLVTTGLTTWQARVTPWLKETKPLDENASIAYFESTL